MIIEKPGNVQKGRRIEEEEKEDKKNPDEEKERQIETLSYKIRQVSKINQNNVHKEIVL